jgi:hypothetical protein
MCLQASLHLLARTPLTQRMATCRDDGVKVTRHLKRKLTDVHHVAVSTASCLPAWWHFLGALYQ